MSVATHTKFEDYKAPLGRTLTPAEHAEHLEMHAELARRISLNSPDDEAQYHTANAASFAYGAHAIRNLINATPELPRVHLQECLNCHGFGIPVRSDEQVCGNCGSRNTRIWFRER